MFLWWCTDTNFIEKNELGGSKGSVQETFAGSHVRIPQRGGFQHFFMNFLSQFKYMRSIQSYPN